MKELILISILITISATNCIGQIKGKVFDEERKPIEYANIFIKSTPSNGCVSNSDGDFKLDCIFKITDTLIVSHIAYKTKKIPIKNNMDSIIVLLNGNSRMLDEIIIESTDRFMQKIIENIPKNYPTTKLTNTFHLIYQNFKSDSTLLGYFNGKVLLNFNTYVGKKKKIKGFLSGNHTNIRNYKIMPSFYYKTPSNILNVIYPENLPFIENINNYNFEKILNNEDYFVVSFKPKLQNKFMYEGVFYVDVNSYSIIYVKINLVPHDENKDKLISLSFRKSSTYTKYDKEKIEIFYHKTNTSRYKINKLLYKSAMSFVKKENTYNLYSNLFLLNTNEESENYSNLKRLNLFSLKTGIKGNPNDTPLLDPMLKKAVEKIIEEEGNE